MTVLLLDRSESHFRHAPDLDDSLSDWLSRDWGLLFSHADDFAQHDIESDRWLVLLEEAFEAARIRPFALLCRSDAQFKNAASWPAKLSGGARIALADLCAHPRIANFRVHALRDAISSTNSRFVMIIDDDLRVRRTFAYDPQDALPSLFDLIATAQALRIRNIEQQTPSQWIAAGAVDMLASE